jgi:carboxymethylenebutenolidase
MVYVLERMSMMYETESTFATSPAGIPFFEVHPVGAGPFACLVVLHERYGLVEHTTDLAGKLARDGYAVIAPNLFYEYEDQEALRLATASTRVRDDRAMELLDDVVPLFATVANADPSRLGMLGACATGRYPVLWGADRSLDACVVLHGLYANREWDPDGEYHLEPMRDLVQRMQAPFLGMFGELDHMIPVEDVRFIRDHFEACNKSYQITLYAGAPHGWMNSTMPGRYRPEITEESWAELLQFLDSRLRRGETDDGLVRWRFNLTKQADYDFSRNVPLH